MTPPWTAFDAPFSAARRTPCLASEPYRAAWLWFGVALLAYGIELLHTFGLTQSDYLFFATTARDLSPLHPQLDPFTLGLYPAGYFQILAVLFRIIPSELFAGQLLSIVSAAACVALATTLAHRLFRDRTLASFVGLFLILHPSMRFWAVAPGMDLPWLALFLASLVPLLCGTPRLASVLISGVLGGLAYDVRYTSLVLPPLAVLLLLSHFRLRTATWGALGVWIGGFVLAASPQLHLATAVLGSPFANAQGMNVYFYSHYVTEATAATAWAEHWRDVPPNLSTMDAILLDPGAVAMHWLGNIWRFVVHPWVLPLPLSLLVVVGGVQLYRSNRAALLRLLLVVGLYLAGIAQVLAASRFLLPVVVLLSLPAVALFGKWKRTGVAALAAMLAVLVITWTPDSSPLQRERWRVMAELSETLAARTGPGEVISTDAGLYLEVDGQLHSLVPLLAYRPPFASVEHMFTQTDAAANVRFVVYESEVGAKLAPGLASLLTADEIDGYRRIARWEGAGYTLVVWEREVQSSGVGTEGFGRATR